MQLTKEKFIRDFKDTLHEEQLIKVPDATPAELFSSLAKVIRKYYTPLWLERNRKISENHQKVAYYFSIEFLPGRMLETNLLNLGILDTVKEGFADLGIDFNDVKNAEHDMALGNGGLGRLAAAFMDSLATTGYPGFGNGLRYKYGLFKQRIVNGYQTELPDSWFGSVGNVWETRKDHGAVEVKLFGNVYLQANEEGRIVLSMTVLRFFAPYLTMFRRLVLAMTISTISVFGMLKSLKNMSLITRHWKIAGG